MHDLPGAIYMSQVLESDTETRPSLLPFTFARRFGVAITTTDGAQPVDVAYRKQPDLTVLAELRRFAGAPIALRHVSDEEFEAILSAAYSRDSSQARQMVEDMGDELDLASLADSVPETEDLLDQEDDAPIIRLINALLAEAIRENASDIHIETFEKQLVVRFRVDGVMREIVQPKRALAPLLVSRIKVMAKLDIAEKRVPQDGRISLADRRPRSRRARVDDAGQQRRARRAAIARQTGRALEPEQSRDVREDADRLREVVHKPHGIFLVTGPTGDGKTTTLYSSLAELESATINILTVEDPIEYNLPGIGQTQVNNKADMTFARGLRAILRQDPDVVMVGEIRDFETAEIAVQASLTGHLVMSTLHTNTAVGAVMRLVDLGVEPYLVATSLVGMLAQRLVRVLCPDCRRTDECRQFRMSVPRYRLRARADDLSRGGLRAVRSHRVSWPHRHLRAGRCRRRRCANASMIASSEQELTRHVRKTCPGIREDGRDKILSGVTTVQEILRVTLED